MTELFRKTAAYVRLKMSGEHTGHDWFHIERVWKMAKRIQSKEGGDLEKVELLALLHDIGDTRNYEFEEKKGPLVLRGMMDILDMPKEQQDELVKIIGEMKYQGDDTKAPESLEGRIAQDADMLDALGAIGVARVFATGGHIKRVLHHPEHKPRRRMTREDYVFRKQEGTSINYFSEKVLKLPKLFNTATGKKLAERRVKFIEHFLKEFDRDWKGED